MTTSWDLLSESCRAALNAPMLEELNMHWVDKEVSPIDLDDLDKHCPTVSGHWPPGVALAYMRLYISHPLTAQWRSVTFSSKKYIKISPGERLVKEKKAGPVYWC